MVTKDNKLTDEESWLEYLDETELFVNLGEAKIANKLEWVQAKGNSYRLCLKRRSSFTFL